ncbi:hypothetical protein YA0089_27285 [Pseudomonas viridiflava]|nr:hypothetical protein [Pseudomonas viridiflava]
MAESDLHKLLCKKGASWFRSKGFPIAAPGISTHWTKEKPDVVSFRSNCSAIIECKTTRGDFLADAKKPFRSSGGVGTYRFYLCPVDLIKIDELPLGWGLLYFDGKKVIEVVCPMGNLWPHQNSSDSLWDHFKHPSDVWVERSMMFALMRRMAQGEGVHL